MKYKILHIAKQDYDKKERWEDFHFYEVGNLFHTDDYRFSYLAANFCIEQSK